MLCSHKEYVLITLFKYKYLKRNYKPAWKIKISLIYYDLRTIKFSHNSYFFMQRRKKRDDR